MADGTARIPKCPLCLSEIATPEEAVVCSACGIPHHAECWQYNRGCTTYGCEGAPRPVRATEVDRRDTAEVWVEDERPPIDIPRWAVRDGEHDEAFVYEVAARPLRRHDRGGQTVAEWLFREEAQRGIAEAAPSVRRAQRSRTDDLVLAGLLLFGAFIVLLIIAELVGTWTDDLRPGHEGSAQFTARPVTRGERVCLSPARQGERAGVVTPGWRGEMARAALATATPHEPGSPRPRAVSLEPRASPQTG